MVSLDVIHHIGQSQESAKSIGKLSNLTISRKNATMLTQTPIKAQFALLWMLDTVIGILFCISQRFDMKFPERPSVDQELT